MEEKKNRERFSIKFNENDPAHAAVIRLLEKQGAHSKAQFIVNAVLHYVNCPKAPDISLPQAADRASIERIVMEILHSRDNGQQDGRVVTNAGRAIREEQVFADLSEQRYDAGSEQKGIGGDTWAMIADTMSAFRNS
ncbi:MAG: hypothetical protein NC305_16690 [Lachnospiraceae bacterium]|nr:hypothetical protein [Lachnospiraceae bacterium]